MDSSPDRSEDMETEQPQMPAKNKQANRKSATQKSLSLVDDVETIDDNDFKPEETTKKRVGGRKPANSKATKPPLASTKKRGQSAKSQNLGQKLITEVLKPVAEKSPEKKVRKKRALPFNKKSSSILGRTVNVNDDDDDDEEASPGHDHSVSTLGSGSDVVSSEEVALKGGRRPLRGNRTNARYVISDDDSEDEAAEDDDDATEDDDSL